MIKLECIKHKIPQPNKNNDMFMEQYFELETEQGTYLVCGACFAEASWKAQTEALKNTPGITVEELTFVGEKIND